MTPSLLREHFLSTVSRSSAMKFVPDTSIYPFDDPSFVAGFDDGTRCQQTLTAPSNSWRLEKYAASSNVLVIDQFESHPAQARYCDDGEISELLEVRLLKNFLYTS